MTLPMCLLLNMPNLNNPNAGEHESSRRLKTELLVQMEGCDPSSATRRVLLIGATNRPEELDEAARRRMPKQLYIPLPCAAARRYMLDIGLGGLTHDLTEEELLKIVRHTDGYSGSDMRVLINEAANVSCCVTNKIFFAS